MIGLTSVSLLLLLLLLQMVPLWDCMLRNTDYYSQQLEALKGRSPPSRGDEDPSTSNGGSQEDGAMADTASATKGTTSSPSVSGSGSGSSTKGGSSAAGDGVTRSSSGTGSGEEVDDITDEDVDRWVANLEQEEQ